MSDRDVLSGVLVVDKPQGLTSFDIVAQARRLYGTRSVGHAGTLDPMATGVLVLMFGEATKLSNHLTNANKAYEAKICFGVTTDTWDADGSAVSAPTPVAVDPDALQQALLKEGQRTSQTPPAHSAVKLAGQRAYSLARQGIEVQLPAREVKVYRIELRSHTGDEAHLGLEVSKGYYVRALAHDLCKTLGVPGHLCSLRRVRSGCFSIDHSVQWPPETPPPLLSLAEASRKALPVTSLTGQGVVHARHGKLLATDDFEEEPCSGLSAWFGPGGELVALGVVQDGCGRVTRGFRL